MQYNVLYALALFTFFSFAKNGFSQGCGDLNMQLKADIPSTCNFSVMTMIHDALDRPYLYVANKEAGLVIYDISNLSSPSKVTSVPTSQYGSLDVMSLNQDGNFLYLALGNHFDKDDEVSGMAIVNVENPVAPITTDYWTHTEPSGAGIVKVEGDYAYLGAMLNGLIILDISDKSDIKFKSEFMPDINYPTSNPNPDLYNARGMEVKNSIVYLCFDAGGMRIINAIDKSNPKETGRYSNPLLNGHPRAYNNVVLDDSYLYITVDYCGLEVLDISDTSDIKLIGKWNPYNCPQNNWFASPTHTNEIQYEKNCKLLFISSGKSDLNVLDISDPQNPDSCNYYGGVSNNIGTWGVGLYKDQVYLSYVCAIIPFASNWTGVKILTYTPCGSGLEENPGQSISVYPVPAYDKLTLELSGKLPEGKQMRLVTYDLMGHAYFPEYKFTANGEPVLDISELTSGFYILKMQVDDEVFTAKFSKE